MTGSAVDSDEFKAILDSIHATPLATIVTDPRQPDNPIIDANEPFTLLTGYAREEILGRNCRFLAGSATEPEARRALREAVAKHQPIVVELTNYKKGPTTRRMAPPSGMPS
jgi:PAS domain S-box-containing protein